RRHLEPAGRSRRPERRRRFAYRRARSARRHSRQVATSEVTPRTIASFGSPSLHPFDPPNTIVPAYQIDHESLWPIWRVANDRVLGDFHPELAVFERSELVDNRSEIR